MKSNVQTYGCITEALSCTTEALSCTTEDFGYKI